MPVHVFVDETKSRGLLMAAARCQADDVAVHRKALRSLLLPGQERLHFNHERDPHRKKIVRTISEFRLTVDIYHAERDNTAARQRCLEAIVRDNAATAERLVVERDESTYGTDGKVLNAATHRFGCHGKLRWDLLAAKADPLLWVPDAVAWCWMRGGEWRRMIQGLCEVKDL
ncbi:hypothetical protein AB0P21_29490 [Kribbella sp. NPDC056861]|uniref:hypothetical protein n=1 Tax=Kribbella sp. NPDC056861 TaxID=3154857 RepID=UPI003427F642